MLSKTEWVARRLTAHYLPNERVAYNVGPEWLINPETGRALEIDVFLGDQQIGLGFEEFTMAATSPGC
jgi:hypothetical protein